jgi:hypothetical protein
MVRVRRHRDRALSRCSNAVRRAVRAGSTGRGGLSRAVIHRGVYGFSRGPDTGMLDVISEGARPNPVLGLTKKTRMLLELA